MALLKNILSNISQSKYTMTFYFVNNNVQYRKINIYLFYSEFFLKNYDTNI